MKKKTIILHTFSLFIGLVPMPSLAQKTLQQIPLWPQGAPGFEDRSNEPEQAKDWWVRNIHNPSITVYLPPPEKATGAAVVRNNQNGVVRRYDKNYNYQLV